MSSKITEAVDFSVNTDSEYEQLHRISPASYSDLHSFGPAQGRPVTGKTVWSPPHAYLHCTSGIPKSGDFGAMTGTVAFLQIYLVALAAQLARVCE